MDAMACHLFMDTLLSPSVMRVIRSETHFINSVKWILREPSKLPALVQLLIPIKIEQSQFKGSLHLQFQHDREMSVRGWHILPHSASPRH